METRQRSIQILKEAIENKTLSAYKGATKCLYYDKDTDSCCAVGALIPREELMKNVDTLGDVTVLVREGWSDISDILNGEEWQNNTGLSDEELIKLQKLHDNMIAKRESPEQFEKYVNSLV